MAIGNLDLWSHRKYNVDTSHVRRSIRKSKSETLSTTVVIITITIIVFAHDGDKTAALSQLQCKAFWTAEAIIVCRNLQ